MSEVEDFENEDQEPQISDEEKIDMLELKLEKANKRIKELELELKKKYSIFYPKTVRGLLSDYPEIKKVREFQINKMDLLFVWYYACEGSPFAGIADDKERTMKSIEEVWKKPPMDMVEKYIAGNFPEKVKIAISKMRSFRVSPRVMAMKMMENTLNNWRAITDIDASDDAYFVGKDGVDWAKKKAFIEAGATISKNIGTVLSQVEGSYSVSEKQDEQDMADFDNLIEDFHDSTE